MVITCDNPTPNHASGHALLHKYDTDKDGTIAMPEMMAAPGDYFDGKITKEESEYVIACWKLGAGGIDKMCPPRRPPCGGYGDIDGDGYVTMKDVDYLNKYLAGIPGYTLTEDQKRRANVTGDGKIDVGDVATIHRYVAQVYDTFPVCKAAAPKVEPAAKRLTYEESLELVNAGSPVYIKFDIPILDQIPGIQWRPGIPILPGFMLTMEP